MVGALLVSGVETVWSGVEIPKYASRIKRKDYRGKNIRIERFAEMARFNYGSTVICLWSKDVVQLNSFATETPTILGRPMGKVINPQ